jgi:hypothetical protein
MVEPLVEQAIRKLGTISEAAEKLDVSEGYVYMLLCGERQPGKKVLEKLGLAQVKLITRAG